jgi:hypothetical protein
MGLTKTARPKRSVTYVALRRSSLWLVATRTNELREIRCQIMMFSQRRIPKPGILKTIGFLTLSNPIFLSPTYSPALIYFGRERGWWITCNYPEVLKKKNRNIKSTTCAICWLKSVLHEEKHREQENHNDGRNLTWFLFMFFSFKS